MGMEEAIEAMELQSCTTGVLDMPDETGDSALHVAVRKGHHKCVQVLIEAGADVNREGANGLTSLMLAAVHHHIGIMRLLLVRGHSCRRTDTGEICHANEKNREGRTALHVAAASCNAEAVQLLLEEGVSALERDSYGRTPLHYVAALKSYSNGMNQVGRIFELLLGTGRADINAADFHGQTPLMDAVARNQLAVT
ncbi:hypothetical protein V2G26_020089 [Clonostachys chloroleuca]